MRRVFIGVFIRLTWFHPLLLLMPLIRFLLDYIFLVFEDSLVLYCRLSAHAHTLTHVHTHTRTLSHPPSPFYSIKHKG